MPAQQYTGGGVAPVGQVPSASPTTPKTSIWDDPNLLAIMLGTGAQAVMGKHQQSWQAQLGKGATGLGRSFKMADVVARREQERKAERDRWMKIIESVSGLHKPSEEGTMALEGLEMPAFG